MRIESYDLDLDIDFPRARVVGHEVITVVGAQRPFALDCAGLGIRSVKVNGKTAQFRLDKPRAKLTISSVPNRKSMVEIQFEKVVSDESIFGLYKARYGKDYMLTTDLEPAEARTVFPCFDEPIRKAVFRLSITTQKGLSAIANTPAVRVEQVTGTRTKYVFGETPLFSTFLFFFGVG